MSSLDELAGQLGWHREGKCLMGKHEGYLFTIGQQEVGLTTIWTQLQSSDKQQVAALAAAVRARHKEHGVKAVTSKDELLIVKYPGGLRSLKGERVINLLDIVVGILREHDIPPHGSCVECGEKDNCFIALINEQPVNICEECFRKTEQNFQGAEREYLYEEKRYGIGLVGALLGALVGAIPWVIIAHFGYFVGILGFLIGLAALKGYNLLGAKVGPATKWIVLAAIILALLVAQSVSIVIEMVQADIPVTIITFFAILSIPEVTSAVIKDVLISLLIAGLGVWPLFSQIKTEAPDFTAKRLG